MSLPVTPSIDASTVLTDFELPELRPATYKLIEQYIGQNGSIAHVSEMDKLHFKVSVLQQTLQYLCETESKKYQELTDTYENRKKQIQIMPEGWTRPAESTKQYQHKCFSDYVDWCSSITGNCDDDIINLQNALKDAEGKLNLKYYQIPTRTRT